MQENERPNWANDRNPDDAGFMFDFIRRHNVTYYKGRFYDVNGCIRDEDVLRREIYRMLRPYYRSGLLTKVENLLAGMRLELQCDDIRKETHLIHVANGTVDITKDFYEHKHICLYRLPVTYDPLHYSIPHWHRFVNELLEPEDVLTLQEYMGYCLIPTNAAQKMLMILGDGGEGKSRIGVVMRAILGDAMKNGSISKVERDRFARADLENALVMVDDDLKLEALDSTNHIKSIITADTPMDLERKGEQSYQGQLNCRLLAFGNGSLQALHDRSYGFFRRQIILKAKPRDPNRVDDPYLGQRLADEADSIFLWSLEGLRRLIDNDFRFTISQRSQQNWQEAVMASNNIVQFLDSTGYILFDRTQCATSRSLYSVYLDWCEDNAEKPLSKKSFWAYLSNHGHKYGLEPSNHIPIGLSRQGRGFHGIHVLPRV